MISSTSSWLVNPKSVFCRTRHRRFLSIIIGLVLWVCVVLPVFYAFKRENMSDSSLEYLSADSQDRLNVDLRFLSLDPQGHSANIMAKFKPRGKFISEDRRLTTNLTVDFNFRNFQLQESSLIEQQLIQPIVVGSLRDYPFDVYKVQFPVVVSDQKKSNIPLNIKLSGSSHLFIIHYHISKADEAGNEFDIEPGSVVVSISLTRPNSVIVISFIFAFLMWAMAISIANNAWDTVFYNRDVNPALLGVGVVIIISLPGFRNSQSGIPLMVCISDMLGFFWCISLSVISTSSIILRYALNWKPQFMESQV